MKFISGGQLHWLPTFSSSATQNKFSMWEDHKNKSLQPALKWHVASFGEQGWIFVFLWETGKPNWCKNTDKNQKLCNNGYWTGESNKRWDVWHKFIILGDEGVMSWWYFPLQYCIRKSSKSQRVFKGHVSAASFLWKILWSVSGYY